MDEEMFHFMLERWIDASLALIKKFLLLGLWLAAGYTSVLFNYTRPFYNFAQEHLYSKTRTAEDAI